jgi:hypothetical protein
VRKESAVAGSTGNYLVAFTETTTSDDVHGQLVAPGGALSGSAFLIAAGTAQEHGAAASFDGTNFDVVWTGGRAQQLYGSRVSAAGAVLDTHLEGTATVGGTPISATAVSQSSGSIACTAAGCAVAWADRRNITTAGWDVYGQLLTTDFTAAGGELAISTVLGAQQAPRVTAGAGSWAAVWLDARSSVATATGARISSAGAVLDPAGFALVAGNNQELAPALGRAGSTIALAWSDSRATGGSDIEMVRLDTTGKQLDASAVALAAAPYAQITPAITGVSTGGFAATWADARSGVNKDIYAARADTSGAVLDASGIAVSTATGDKFVPVIASSGNESLVVWQDRTTGAAHVYGAILSTSGTASPPFVICSASGEQQSPAVSWDATASQYVVVWTDTRNPSYAIYGTRVDPSGNVLDPGGVVIATAAGNRFQPDIATTSGVSLVVYEDQRNPNRDIYATRVTAGAALTVLDPNGIQLTTDASKQVAPMVAVIGSSFLVAWTDPRNYATSLDDIYGQLVNGDGTLNGSNFAISSNPEDETSPAVVSASGSSVLVAYSKKRTDIDSARVVTRVVETLAISVSPASATIAKGTTQPFTATSVAPDGTTQDVTTQVTWSSSDTSIAPITSGGVASGAAQGTVTITATLGATSGTATLTVDPPALKSIAVTPAGATIAKGTTQAYTAIGTYTDGSTQNLTTSVTWGSSAPSTAQITTGGLATGLLQGTVTISATLGAVSGSTTLTIGPAALVTIDVEPALPTLPIGDTQPMAAIGTYTDGTIQVITTSVSWSSSNAGVATIISSGLATGVATGTSTITATLGAISGSTTLTVTAASLCCCVLLPTTTSIAKGTTTSFTLTAVFTDNTTQDVTTTATWTSHKTTVATISNASPTQGLAKGVGSGTATISAALTVNGVTCSEDATLTVTPATLSSISVTPATATIAKGTAQQFTATGTYSDGSTQDISTLVTWGSSNTTAASVSTPGLATGLAAGTTTISATLSGKTGSAILTVTEATLTSITVTPGTAKIPKGFKQQYTATGNFSDGTTQNLTTQVAWTSSNTTVATISDAAGSNGLATVAAVGATTITAQFGTVTGTATLTGGSATLTKILVSPSGPLNLSVGATVQLTATGKFSDGTQMDITNQVSWSSSSRKVATVSETGQVHALVLGTTTIRARKGVLGSVIVTVN